MIASPGLPCQLDRRIIAHPSGSLKEAGRSQVTGNLSPVTFRYGLLLHGSVAMDTRLIATNSPRSSQVPWQDLQRST